MLGSLRSDQLVTLLSTPVLALVLWPNHHLISLTCSLVGWSRWCQDEAEAAQQRAEGYALYEEKPNLRRRDRRQIGTWSDEECERTASLSFC